MTEPSLVHAAGLSPQVTDDTVERQTRLGTVRGLKRLGAETFRGIRYGTIPGRFRASELSGGWSGVLDATGFGPQAMQDATGNAIMGDLPAGELSEDCLFLNIHTPSARRPEGLPVLVWIHGGSFTSGSANQYDGTALAVTADAVVVAINYRLGLFGQADVRSLGEEFSDSCNVWLTDQINALRWVRQNIADFGGDPACVTVMGQSAGGTSVLTLAASPRAQGLLHRAVALSPALVPNTDPRQAEQIAALRDLQPRDVPRHLMEATAEELVALTAAVAPHPWVDGTAIRLAPHEVIADLSSDTVPLITGMTPNEGAFLALMLRTSHVPEPIAGAIGEQMAHKMFGDSGSGGTDYLRRLTDLEQAQDGFHLCELVWTDLFRQASTTAAEAASAGAGGWHYVFDVPCTMGGVPLPSTHGVCLPFTFNWFADPERALGHDWLNYEDPELRRLAENWVGTLAAFARSGSPQAALGTWPQHEPTRRRSLWLRPGGTSVIEDCAATHRSQVWRSQ